MLGDPLLLVFLAVVTVLAAVIHAALGFGSGPLLVPALLLAFDPAVAVVSAVLVGMVVNVLQLVTERRRPQVPAGRLLPLWLGALPGTVAGSLVAGGISASALAVILAIALILSAASLFFFPSAGIAISSRQMAFAGAITVASAALTGILGPLLGVVLVAAGERERRLRDGLGASFLVVGGLAVATSLAFSGAWSAFAVAGTLSVPAGAGYLLGRRGAGLLGPVYQRRAVLVAVLTGAALALARATG